MASFATCGTAYLGEQCIQAVDLLLFLYKCIVLGHTPKRKLVHEIDLVWLVQVFIL